MSKEGNRGQDRTDRFIIKGRNCWKTEHANRVAFLVDAESYFHAFKSATLRARRSILIIGWDVNSRTPLEFPDDARPDVPNELGMLLSHLATRRDGLQINVLNWDSPLFYSLDREWLTQARFDWFTHPRVCFALDDQHPLGASHHQKTVVIDDSIAFVGGIDLTVSRLDGPEHFSCDRRRRNPDGAPYGPYHDVQVAVDGAAAQAIADVARDRWARATGQRLRPTETAEDCWPEDLPADIRDIEVAIARTHAAWKGRPEAREIEALFLDAIGRATQTVYIENQYFSATTVARAILDRLGNADCPEIVLVLPQEPTGWLEQNAMGVRQRCLLARLRNADKYGRFRVYMPVVGAQGDVPVKVHAKLMIVDGRFSHIGSANLNNRSMGLDTECDLAVEGEPGSLAVKSITAFRNRLLAEHLGVSLDSIVKEISVCGSLIGAIEKLTGSGRSLVSFPNISPDPIDTALADSELLDPDRPVKPEQIADQLAGDKAGQMTLRSALVRLAAVVIMLLGLAALWRWGPISEFVDVSTLVAWVDAQRSGWSATAAILLAYVIGGLVMFPVIILIAATGLFYGPLTGLLVAGTGSVLGAVTGYGMGLLLGRKGLRRLSGGWFDRISLQLARRGLLSMTVIRLLPVAPFTVVNIAAGAAHIRFRDFVFGTMLGMAPGISAITLFSSQLGEVVHEPSALNIGVLIALLLVIGAAVKWSWRHFIHRRADADEAQ